MPALNISFNIPQSPSFSVDDFRKQMLAYANKLTSSFKVQSDPVEEVKGHRILSYEEMSPEIQSLIGICDGAVSEQDLNADTYREQALREKYETE